MPKITPLDPKAPNKIIKTGEAQRSAYSKWWKEPNESERASQLLATAGFLKEQLQHRYRQANVYSRLYGNLPLMGIGGMAAKLNDTAGRNNLPLDRPTMNVVQSCVDTLVARISQSRPRPVFLTDAGDYKQRTLSKQLNTFIGGELYRTKAYEMGVQILRDACVLGTGCIKVLESHGKVALERVLLTELLVDHNDGLYGTPRTLYQLSLVDRDVLAATYPKEAARVALAEQAYPQSGESSKTTSDQVMVVEAWHLPSGPDAGDGKHTIACTSGMLAEESYDKDKFPFVFLGYSPRMLGFFSQGLAEQLMGTQVEINKMMITASKSVGLVGVPRIFLEAGSKVVKSHFNNEIGSMITYQGREPLLVEGNTGLAPDFYNRLQSLIEYAYQQSGISSLAATSQKPSGLDSGQALREYDDLQSDRFATLNKRYDNLYIELAYLIVDQAMDIVERDGSYTTVYPADNGTQEVDLPKAKMLKNTYVIQCLDSSSLPKDPAGRKQSIIDDMQAGLLTPEQGRRLLDYPDLEQEQKLMNAAEERILKILDEIVEDGKYTPPDQFMDLQLAVKLSVQYYNLYTACKLEPERAEMLQSFNSQAQAFIAEATAPPPVAPGAPQAAPMPQPTSPLIPNVAQPQ